MVPLSLTKGLFLFRTRNNIVGREMSELKSQINGYLNDKVKES